MSGHQRAPDNPPLVWNLLTGWRSRCKAYLGLLASPASSHVLGSWSRRSLGPVSLQNSRVLAAPPGIASPPRDVAGATIGMVTGSPFQAISPRVVAIESGQAPARPDASTTSLTVSSQSATLRITDCIPTRHLRSPCPSAAELPEERMARTRAAHRITVGT